MEIKAETWYILTFEARVYFAQTKESPVAIIPGSETARYLFVELRRGQTARAQEVIGANSSFPVLIRRSKSGDWSLSDANNAAAKGGFGRSYLVRQSEEPSRHLAPVPRRYSV